MNILQNALNVIDLEISGLELLKSSIGKTFEEMVNEIYLCEGNIIFMGVGKSGHVCKKIVATMQSLGIKATFIHPVEALHGDLGFISSKDIVIAISNSGESVELINTLRSISIIDAKLLCIVGKENSTLGKKAALSLVLPSVKEVFLEGMVPTTSTTVQMVVGDALAVCVASKKNFNKEEFGIYHPHGNLGKILTLRVSDIMIPEKDGTSVSSGTSVRQAIFEMCRNPIGGINVVDSENKLLGVFTDGDFRRLLNDNPSYDLGNPIDEVMTKNPICVSMDSLVYDEICKVVSKNTVSYYPVIDFEKTCVGSVRMLDFVNSGLMR